MKKITLFLLVLLTNLAVHADDLTGIKIYINPGHGGYTGNDRNIVTIPFDANDPNGYWESTSNLLKGFALQELLESAGATVLISRTQNREEDDRNLSEIVAESNANNVDAFLSIHSNAGGALTNYCLMLYAGVDPGDTWTYPTPTPFSNEGRALSIFIGNNIVSNLLTVWTSSSAAIRGDKSFGRIAMGGWTDGYGALRGLTTTGLISEGEFHEYKPETHRLLNEDYCALEAYQFYRAFCSFFEAPQMTSGIIAGYVKSENEIINHPRYAYVTNSQDRWLPLNGATVKLFDETGTDELDSYTTDDLYNGIFVFYNLDPGNYKVTVSAPSYETKTADITVTAAKTSYAKFQVKNIRMDLPDYPDPEQEAGTMPLSNYDFEAMGAAVNPEWLSSNDIKRVLYRNEKLYVLTTDPKILVINAKTATLIKELDMTDTENISDIAFTADNFLLACNRETIAFESPATYFNVYTWDDDDSSPRLLFQSQKNGNWTNGVVGETLTASGPRWKCKIYTTAISTSPSSYRIVGFQYNEDEADVIFKYIMDTDNYTINLWGEHPVFTITPNGNNDHLYIDSEVMLPVEYQFDWTAADREPMVKVADFEEVSGYTLPITARGGNFFRNAKHSYLVMPVCEADGANAGVVLFDVNDGLDKAIKVSEKYPNGGLGETPASYMAATGLVNGYDIELMILAKNQGMALYKTIDVPTANIYASELSISPENAFKFTLNENAQSVVITVFNEDAALSSHDAGALAKGAHTIDNPFGGIDFNAWSVTATARPVGRPVKLTGNEAIFQFFALRGIAVDNSPASPFFGRVYATEYTGGAATGRTTQKGVYILNPLWEDVTGQGVNAYGEGVCTPLRASVAPDGNVYLADWTDNPSAGVWVMNPADPSAAFRPVFGGTVNSIGLATNEEVEIHGSVSDCWITGSGDNTVLYTFDEDAIVPGRAPDMSYIRGGNLFRYDIGSNTTPWVTAPSAVVYDDVQNGNLQKNGNSQIAPDGRGGWWISQYRSEGDASTPVLIHVPLNGIVNYNSGSTITSSDQGGMAVTDDGSMIAIGGPNNVRIFTIDFEANDVPKLTLAYSFSHNNGATYSCAFDVSGNLYVAANKALSVWTMPKVYNSHTTRVQGSPVTGIHAIKPVEVKVYPNPVVSDMFINGGGALITGYTLFDMNGRMVLSGKVNTSQTTVSVTGVNAGIYVLQVRTTEGVVTKRIIKR